MKSAVTFDEPHVSMRCEENNISKDDVLQILLDENAVLIRLVEDRPRVYKLYYRLGRKTELKMVVDLLTYGTINVRTVKKLSEKFRLGVIRKRRF